MSQVARQKVSKYYPQTNEESKLQTFFTENVNTSSYTKHKSNYFLISQEKLFLQYNLDFITNRSQTLINPETNGKSLKILEVLLAFRKVVVESVTRNFTTCSLLHKLQTV